jgi:NAD(P)-dependent dehydrogenase (short-subunit alcohol dehydrogenase family)
MTITSPLKTTTTPGLLDGKAILIVGASQGIGAAAARHFAAEGARLVIGARNLDATTAMRDELRSQGHDAESVFIDVTDRATIAAAVALTVSTYGRLDGAFNNAGASALAPFIDYTEEVFDHLIAVNLKGVFLAMQDEIRAMLQTGGAIVNTSSVGGLVGNFGLAPYIAAKHGVIGLTKSAAYEYDTQNIRVNAIAPGSTATEMFLGGLAHTPPELASKFNTFRPMDRIGQPEEIAAGAAWLLSDQASYITGVTLPIDGGFLGA